MICARHDWWNIEPCLKCISGTVELVTDAETKDDPLDIPDFLKRNPDGSFISLPPWDIKTTAAVLRIEPQYLERPYPQWTDAELNAAFDNTELTLVERQPIYMELRAREDKKKAHARIAAMKEKKAGKET